MRCHGPGCGGSPHDIEHRHFTWSGGARDRGCRAAIPGNQREYDIQHGLVDIVARTMTITWGRLKREDFSSVYFDAHQRVQMLLQQGAAFVNAVLEQLRTDGQLSASYAHWIGTPVPAPPAAEDGS